MRNQALDVLRAAAVILVFCYHSEGALLISRFGWTGVDLFFVLSGYLVSGLLFREYQASGKVEVGRFLIRRGCKIYPQFYLLLLVTFLWSISRGGLAMRSLWAELFFYQSYVRGLWTHTWSLAVEEHFYLLLAGGIWLLVRRGGGDPFARLPAGILALAAGTLALRTGLWWLGPEITELRHVFPSHLRMDSFLGGVLVAYYQTFRPEQLASWVRRAAAWLPQASMLLLCPVTFLKREDPFMVTVGFTMVAWAFVLLLVSALYPLKRSSGEPGWGLRAMSQLGRNSYGFYLWHGPVILVCDGARIVLAARGTEVPLVATLVVSFALSYLAAVVTTQFLEAPSLRWRDRLFPPSVKTELPPPVVLGRRRATPAAVAGQSRVA